MEVNIGHYGDMILYAVFKEEIDQSYSIGERVVMAQFTSKKAFNTWVTNGYHQKKVAITCCRVDSVIGKNLKDVAPDEFKALEANDDAILLIPFFITDKIMFINRIVFSIESMTDEQAEAILSKNKLHSCIK